MSAATPAPVVRGGFLALLVAVSAVNPLAINMFMPSMPRMAADFGTTYATVQLTLSLYLAVMAVAQLVIGPLSDRYGRRPVMLAGLGVFVVGSVIALFAQTIWILLAGRLLQGAGGCAGIVLARAAIRDLYDRDRAAGMIGYVTMGMAVAPMVAPAIGGLLEETVGWRGSFVVMLACGVGALIWSIVALAETNRNRGAALPLAVMVAQWRALAAVPAFWAFTGTSAFASAVFFAFLGGAPYVTHDLMHVSPLDYGLWFILVSLGYIAGNGLSGRFAGRLGVPRMITLGNTLQVGAMAGMVGAFAFGRMEPAALFLPMAVVGLSNGITLPSAIAGMVSVRPDLAGAASGLGGSIQVGVGALASSAAGALLVSLWPGTPWAMVGLMAACALAAAAVGLFTGSDAD